jgi:hypothetical protein
MNAGLGKADDGPGRLAITRTDTGSPPAGVWTASIPKSAKIASTALWNTVVRCVGP